MGELHNLCKFLSVSFLAHPRYPHSMPNLLGIFSLDSTTVGPPASTQCFPFLFLVVAGEQNRFTIFKSPLPGTDLSLKKVELDITCGSTFHSQPYTSYLPQWKTFLFIFQGDLKASNTGSPRSIARVLQGTATIHSLKVKVSKLCSH